MGHQPRYTVNLSEEERQDLEAIIRRGEHPAREINRARMLLWSDEGRKRKEVAELVGCCTETVRKCVKRYLQGGLREALIDRRRKGRPPKIGPKEEALITAIACSEPPDGRARWTLFMIADKLVQLSELDEISHETVRQVLKKTNSSPGSTSTGS